MKSTSILGAAALLVVLSTVAKADKAWNKSVAPFFATYCGQCHGQKDPEEGLTLTPVERTALGEPELLEDIAERLRSQTMPPAEAKK